MKNYRITKDKFLSPKEAKRLLKVCNERAIIDEIKGRRTWVTRYTLVYLALSSGLRVSELASLKISDLQLNGNENYLMVQNGKGGRKRDVYLDREIAKHLKQYISINKKSWAESTDPEAPLFSGRKGHFTTTALAISFKQALREAGLPETYSIHSSRHTYATTLLAKTSNLRFTMKQLGHSNLNMTALYADVLPEQNQSLANAILD